MWPISSLGARMDQELITLTPEQLTEVCVRFAIFMGWTYAPGSLEWVLKVKRTGARFKDEELSAARKWAMILAADEGITTNRAALVRMEATDLG